MGEVAMVRFPDGLSPHEGFWAARRTKTDGVLEQVVEWDAKGICAIFLGNNPGNQREDLSIDNVLSGLDSKDQYATVIQEVIIRNDGNPIHHHLFGSEVREGSIFLFMNGSLSPLHNDPKRRWQDASPSTWNEIQNRYPEITKLVGQGRRLIAVGPGVNAVQQSGFPRLEQNFKLAHPSRGYLSRQVARLNARIRREPNFCPMEELMLSED